MDQIKCPSCGLVNLPGDTACRECGAALVAPPYAAAPSAVVVPPSDTVYVQPSETIVVDEGMSTPAKMLTALLVLIALGIVGFLFYQWGHTDRAEDDAAARASTNRSSETRTTTRTESTPAPAPTTTTVQVPVPVPVPMPGAAPLPPAPSSTTTADSAAARDLAKYTSTLDPLLADWDEALTKAESAQPADMKDAISALQDVQRKVARLSAPASAARVQGHLVTAMTATIDALKVGAAQGGASIATSEPYMQAQKLFEQFQTEYDTLKASRP